MIKPYFSFFLLVFTLISVPLFSMENGDIEDHLVSGKAPPSFVSSVANDCFLCLSNPQKSHVSDWGLWNGRSTYNLLEIDQHELSKKIIENALEEGRKSVAFLDVGAGDFQSCDSWMCHLNERYFDHTLPKLDITFHIVGIRAEPSDKEEVYEYGNCKVYKFGSFNAEDLENEFIRKGIDFQFDLTISNWCMRHLVNPLGTLMQILKRTRYEGFILMDWFLYLYEGENFENRHDLFSLSQSHLFDFLIFLKAPFLIHARADGGDKTLDQFLLLKTESCPQKLPLSYEKIETLQIRADTAKNLVRFKVLDPNFIKNLQTLFYRVAEENEEAYDLLGDLSLFTWLKIYNLPLEESRIFEQLFEIKDQKIIPWRLPQEVRQGKIERKEKLIRLGHLYRRIEDMKKTFYASLQDALKVKMIPPASALPIHKDTDS